MRQSKECCRDRAQKPPARARVCLPFTDGPCPRNTKDASPAARSCGRYVQSEISQDHAQVKGGVAKSIRRSCTTWAWIRPLKRGAKGSLRTLIRTDEVANQEDRRQRILAVRDFFPRSGSFLLNAADPTQVDGTGEAGRTLARESPAPDGTRPPESRAAANRAQHRLGGGMLVP